MTNRYRPREDVAVLLRQGATYLTVQKRLGCGQGVIAATRRHYSIPVIGHGSGYRHTPEQRAQLERQVLGLLLQGRSYRLIREETGASQPLIVRVRREARLPTPGKDYVKPARTVDEALALYSEVYGDGHVRWTGPHRGRASQLCAEGRRYNARRVVFEREQGRPPTGNVIPRCGQRWCIAGAHLTDAVMRGTARARGGR